MRDVAVRLVRVEFAPAFLSLNPKIPQRKLRVDRYDIDDSSEITATSF